MGATQVKDGILLMSNILLSFDFVSFVLFSLVYIVFKETHFV